MQVARKSQGLTRQHVYKSRHGFRCPALYWTSNKDLAQPFPNYQQYLYFTTSENRGQLTHSRTKDKRLLPQQTDLLDIYRGLVTTGRIRHDEDQIRVVMEVCSKVFWLRQSFKCSLSPA